jgi:hypothetical protein
MIPDPKKRLISYLESDQPYPEVMRTNQIYSNPLSILKSRRRVLKGLSWFLTLICLPLFTGCQYYRVQGVDENTARAYAAKIREFNEADKYIIIHQNASSLHLQNARLDESSKELYGVPVLLTLEHQFEHSPEVDQSYRFKKRKQNPLNEVHLYLNDKVEIQLDKDIAIPIELIEKVAFSKYDRGRTFATGFIGFIGVLAFITLIVALTKSSCPFVYVANAETTEFQGELYPGSIMRNAQRPDYLKLSRLQGEQENYTIVITNELLEIQHTDQVALQVVDHPANSQVYMNPRGEVFVIRDPAPPRRAIADDRRDIGEFLTHTDDKTWNFETLLKDSDGKRYVDLEFDPSQMDGDIKLLLSLRNTLWLDYAVGSFYKKFGSYYTQFQRDQQNVTYEDAFRWRSDQSLPLSVYMGTEAGWELQQQIPAVGPMAYRDIVVPINIEKKPEGPVRIRLETGFMFWELDRVALDISETTPTKLQTVYPKLALDQNGRDVSDLLMFRDAQYLTQTEVGNKVTVSYKSPPRMDESRSVFLKSTGYYTYIRDYDGIPNFTELKKFREPGHFTRFAENEYNRMLEILMTRQEDIALSHED